MATAAQQSALRNSYIRFQANVPETVTLNDLGFEVQGQYGPQKKYRLTDGRDMFLDLQVAQSIDTLNIHPGEPIIITKKQGTDGTRRIAWFVERARNQPTQRIPPQPAARMVERAEALDGTYDSAVHASQTPTRLESALRTAVIAAAKAEQYGEQIGYNIRFSPADIRSMGISVLIAMDKGGPR